MRIARSIREYQWALVGALALTALVLGQVGFELLPPRDGELSFSDSLYRSLQLFVLESGGTPPPTPWQLDVARALAPLVAVYAAVGAVLALFREQLQRLRIRLFARDHVVVAGLGAKGFQLARAFREAGLRVVVIERDEQNPLVRSCRERHIPVLAGDASDERLLARARADRARHLVATCGDDGVNAQVALAARLVPRRRSGALTAFVHLDDLDLWRLLGAEELGRAERDDLRLEFFNVTDAAARVMLEEHPFEHDAASPHVLLVGLEELGRRMLLHMAARWREAPTTGERRLRVTVLGPEAGREIDALVRCHPELADLCEIEARTVGPAVGDLDPVRALSAGAAPSVAYVTLPRETDALAAALALRTNRDLGLARVVVAVQDEQDGIATALRASVGAREGVAAFGVLSRTLTPELLLRGTGEVLARAKHEQYVHAERLKGRTPEENPSMRPWEQLPDVLKESNRRFADGIGPKLAAAGLVIVPDPLADPATAVAALSEEEVEELARLEHDRWCRDLERDGWRRTSGAKDPERRLHPQLVTWAELSEEERDKDRDPMRELPGMLARVGFELYRSARDGRR